MNIVFMGTPDFAVPSLKKIFNSHFKIALVVSQPDRPKGRGRKLVPTPVKSAAIELGIEVTQPELAKDPIFIQKIKDISPDLIVVVAFGQILPKSLLNIPPLGCINLHGSLLPAYRGAAPIQRALMNGDKIVGVTTMIINEAMDAGDMLLKKSIEATSYDNAGTISEKLKEIGADLLLETLTKIKEKTISPIPQKIEDVTFAPKIGKDECAVNWSKASEEIHNIIRGLTPAPGAFTFLNGKRVIISDTDYILQENESSIFHTGEIRDINNIGIKVKTGEGSLLIKRLQPEGKREMTSKDFCSGHKIKEGDKFHDQTN